MGKCKIKTVIVPAIAVFMSLIVSKEVPVLAEDVTPSVIYSTIEESEVEIDLSGILPDGSDASTRKWYCNGESIIPDGEKIIDTSEGKDAKLKLMQTTTVNHMQDYKCIDDLSEDSQQVARLYVISKDNYTVATLSTKEISAAVGDEIYAKDITLYIDQTPYPNFAPLRFLINGNVEEKITAAQGTNTYDLTDIALGRTVSVSITGIADEEAPLITSLYVLDDKEDVYATSKTIGVSATDNDSIPEKGYYFVSSESLAETLIEKVLSGSDADSLSGITWSGDSTYEVTSNGTYTVFVRDTTGNISYKSITVSKISSTVPVISSVTLGKKKGTVYIDVDATDSDGQPLKYKLNNGKWQTSSRLKKVKEGTNKIYVKNEAGIKVSTTKDVYLSLYKNEDESFSGESLYNYIQVTPSGWTSGSVRVSLNLPDDIKTKLSTLPYSINGGTYSTSYVTQISENNGTVQFSVKDIYDNVHTLPVYTVTNIDRQIPSAQVTVNGNTFTVNMSDEGSGIANITVSGAGVGGYCLKTNTDECIGSDSVTYVAPSDGTYIFTVTDFAGNTTKVSGTMTYYKDEENRKNEEAANASVKDSKDDSSGSLQKTDGSVLGTKKESTETSEDDNTEKVLSDSGHSIIKQLPEAETIDVVMAHENLEVPVQMIEETELDNTKSNELTNLLFVIPFVLFAVVTAVVLINVETKDKDE
ncbi:MAG: hypothetical protein K6A23_14685 [Butyrivibrio sp.]|nr:hypothetical protein [Butyrivibrio sp.]